LADSELVQIGQLKIADIWSTVGYSSYVLLVN